MAQLIMRWKNDKTAAAPVQLPADVVVKTISEIENGIGQWLNIVKYMDREVQEVSEELYKEAMLCHTDYREDLCFILTVRDVPAATVTVICNQDKKEGYIHMVACKPEFRGRGLGHLLNEVAVGVLKAEGMETAYLTTDDWRIPAIKSYLKAGLTPDLDQEPDFKERWNAIYAEIGI